MNSAQAPPGSGDAGRPRADDTRRIRDEVTARIGPLLAAARIDPGEVDCRIDDVGSVPSGLAVHLRLPVPVPRTLEQALAVRVLDAVRCGGRTQGNVDVHVHGGG
jgi:hypothetical protein